MLGALPIPALVLLRDAPLVVPTTAEGADAIASPAVVAVLRERLRQVEAKGYDPHHDDLHDDAEIARGALAFLLLGLAEETGDVAGFDRAAQLWPFADELPLPGDYPDCLIKAAAMLIAELDRVIRARALIDLVTAAERGFARPTASHPASKGDQNG